MPKTTYKRKRFPKVDGMHIDLSSLRSIAHRCNPALCASARSCCACYEVAVSEQELSGIIGCLPEASRYVPALAGSDLYEENEQGEIILEVDEADRCIFAYSTGPRGTLCSIHSVALDYGIEPNRLKPACCSLWPLALTDSGPLMLSVQEGAFSFPCNTRRPRNAAGLDAGVADIIREQFGPTTLQCILQLV